MKYFFYKYGLFLLILIRVFWILFSPNIPQEFPFDLQNKKNEYSAVIKKIDILYKDKIYFLLSDIKYNQEIIYSDFIRAKVDQYNFQFQVGDEIKFISKIKKPTGYFNPGVFNYQVYLNHKNIGGVTYLDLENTEFISKSKSNFIRDQKNKIRNNIKHHSSSGILLTLLWGERSFLDQKVYHQYKNFGLAHQLVISGLHLGILAGLVYYFLKYILNIFSFLFLYSSRQKISMILSWIFISAYFYICESHVSLARAYIAFSFYIFYKLIGKKISKIYLLGSIFLILILIYPFEIYNPGFWLSIIAVFSLIYFYFPLYLDLKNRNFPKILFYLINLFLINLILFISLQPLLIYFFGEFQPYGLIFNFIMIPVMEFLIMPLNLLGLLIWPIFSEGSFLIWNLLMRVLDQIIHMISYLESYYSIQSYSVKFKFYLWELILIYLLLIFLFLKIKIHKKLIFSLLVGAIFLGDYIYYKFNFHYPDFLEINHLDVGQGDSLFIKFPNQNLMLDVGGNYFFDVGGKIIFPYLQYQRISEIDLLIITHSDLDHYGGMRGLKRKIPIREIWWSGFGDDRLKKEIRNFEELGTKIRIVKANEIISRDRIIFYVLSPDQKYQKDNNQSLVLQMEYEGRKYLFTGDIESEIESDLVFRYGDDLKSDYLKIPHHGSQTSSSEIFLEQIQPQIVSLSAKFQNRFGHPHEKIMDRYLMRNISLFRTDHHGMIQIIFEDESIKIKTFKDKKDDELFYRAPKISQESTFQPKGGIR